MVAFSQTPWSRYRVRSISLPARSHPSTIRVEQQLAKLRSLDSSSFSSIEAICSSLSGLVELYRCINEVLNLPLPQQALAVLRGEIWVQELVDNSVRFLDICDNTRDAILVIKESIRDLQSAIRRSKYEDSGVENSITSYICSRKRIKHESLKKSITSLRQTDYTAGASPPLQIENEVTAAVIRVLREASSVTSSIFNSLLSFLAVPMNRRPKPSRWTLVSRLVQKGAITRNNHTERINELVNLDMAIDRLQLESLNRDGEAKEKIQSMIRERLQGLDWSIERIERGTEGLFRELIHTRVCLLNILSQ
ncbi:uncharacterized protein LOC111781164 [Cucurbita pepo subsp. pepo]|uniref:uncharacterized protein LOC111781164 n=1 Tax=Cucurbita pepo subsp. pepo TaxID=3664 RepID=UPI000C9D42EC|nr:uncharacterized protein LOC111781164 [Cucurbita pepo subsp. pepo]